MPSVRRQILAGVQNGLIRPGADETYADGDDAAWMGVDWPAYTRRMEISGRSVNYVDTAAEDDERPVIVFVHGLGGLWQNWLLNIPAFLETHRMIAMDLPGFGASEMPVEKISITGYARLVDELCDRLGVESATVVGSSMGGFIAAELGLSFGTRVERLVLVSAAGLSIEYQHREPLVSFARLLSANARFFVARRNLVVNRPRLRRAALQTVVRYPERLSAPLTWEQLAG